MSLDARLQEIEARIKANPSGEIFPGSMLHRDYTDLAFLLKTVRRLQWTTQKYRQEHYDRKEMAPPCLCAVCLEARDALEGTP